MKKIMSTVFIVFAMSFLTPLVAPAPNVSAQPSGTGGGSSCGGGSFLSFPRWYDGLCKGSGQIKSPGEMGGLGNFIWTIVLNIVEMMLYLVGLISLAFIIWGGFKYMISGDNASGTASARKTILNAVIGLVLSIMSFAIVNAVVASIGGTIG
ncbi:MAG: hypothetical protein EOP54_16910 [Sphingobacteriales bacterium]|nr:MAG: hypothetical protein EOP54_16910 [Sphingobacteriales bacterium]